MFKVLATADGREYAVMICETECEALGLAVKLSQKARRTSGCVLMGEEVVYKWGRCP